MADEVKTPAEAPKEEAKEKTPTLEELQAEIANLKKAISASNADASKRKKEAEDWQNKYKSTLDEQKRKELEAEQNSKTMAEELAAYKARERVSTYKAKLLAVGYDEEASNKMASELPEGVPDSFFEGQKVFIETIKQTAKTSVINSQPDLSKGLPPSTSNAISEEERKLRKWMGL